MNIIIRNFKHSQSVCLERPDGSRAIFNLGGNTFRRVQGVKMLPDGRAQLIQPGLEPGTIVRPSWFPPDWPWHAQGGH